jgi:outer membrane protein assembly factor BamB
MRVFAALVILAVVSGGMAHAVPKPLPPGAVTEDWPCFLGPSHNLFSKETKLLSKFPAGGLSLVWDAKRGSGYAAPAIFGDRLLMFHRVGNEEIVECLNRETGERSWRFAYPTTYRDRYGYNDGPRAAPVISGENVYTIGAGGVLHCIALTTGHVNWKRELNAEHKIKQNFFGWGPTPLVEGDKLIVNLGAPGGPTVVALDLNTGKTLWGAGTEWGQSYASPVPATVHGKRRVFVFAGGESSPPTGGLLCIDPADGKVDFTHPWRGDRRESVNGSAPLVFGRNGEYVFISECYGSGGTLLEIARDFSFKTRWTNPNFGTHFMTAVHRDGYLYGVDGHGPQDAFLVCVDAATGKEAWRTQPAWRENVKFKNGGERELELGTFRAWLMPVGDTPRVLMLGEFGHLLWVELSPKGFKEIDRTRLFLASETWTPPVLSRGLLYVCQNSEDGVSGAGPRLLCYDLRGDK